MQVEYRSRERFLLYFGKCNLAFMYVSGRNTEVEGDFGGTSVNQTCFKGSSAGGIPK